MTCWTAHRYCVQRQQCIIRLCITIEVYLLAYNSTCAYVMAHIIVRNTFSCLPDCIRKDDAYVMVYVCVYAHIYTQNSSTKDWCILIYLDKWWVYLIFLTEGKLQFAYFLACASCTSLGCLYFQHHLAAYQPSIQNIYTESIQNSKCQVMQPNRAYLHIHFDHIRLRFGLCAFSMECQFQGPNPYFQITQCLSMKISNSS